MAVRGAGKCASRFAIGSAIFVSEDECNLVERLPLERRQFVIDLCVWKGNEIRELDCCISANESKKTRARNDASRGISIVDCADGKVIIFMRTEGSLEWKPNG